MHIYVLCAICGILIAVATSQQHFMPSPRSSMPSSASKTSEPPARIAQVPSIGHEQSSDSLVRAFVSYEQYINTFHALSLVNKFK